MYWKEEFYPTPAEVDQWCGERLEAAQAVSVKGTPLDQMPVTEPFGAWLRLYG